MYWGPKETRRLNQSQLVDQACKKGKLWRWHPPLLLLLVADPLVTPIEQEAVQAAPTPLSPKPSATVDALADEVKPEPSPSADPADAAPANPEELAQPQKSQQDIPQLSIEL
jgi:hypothetical protein